MIEQVRQFHETFGHPVASAPTVGDKALRELRFDLISEELDELFEALGDAGACACDSATVTEPDLVEMADALGDITYVVIGAALAFGIDLEAVVAEIHRSNMSKLGADGKPIYREDGKVLKGPGYSRPNLRPIVLPDEPHPAERKLWSDYAAA
ncbi:nucleoside triphosphate pyrophosphohydrolase family protein [Cellulomonas sp. SG140]|uniref:nucleoside triphosphate pyrophosphohydrolase family protein n=1 Tax=Cellulomonas sp. SG140 TaxID=2976536 RepID=UPI0021E8090E|nr:nucleoside triphosphate pyrophosphohydrolase family protein [Cellulomonas sp. SG140]